MSIFHELIHMTQKKCSQILCLPNHGKENTKKPPFILTWQTTSSVSHLFLVVNETKVQGVFYSADTQIKCFLWSPEGLFFILLGLECTTSPCSPSSPRDSQQSSTSPKGTCESPISTQIWAQCEWGEGLESHHQTRLILQISN